MLLCVSCSTYRPLGRDLYATSDSTLLCYMRLNHIPVTRQNYVHLLNGAHEKFETLFRDIRNAEHHVHLEYFNFRNDSITAALIDLLTQKVRQGVEVRAMFDAFGNASNNRPLKERHLKEIRKKGIEIVKFDPIDFPYVNHASHRDHRKIVVIDGRIAYTGGINVADYYLQGLSGIGEWRDMHVRIEGEAVTQFQDIFLGMWNRETKQAVGGDNYYPLQCDSLSHADSSNLSGTVQVAVVDRWPGETPEAMRKTYAQSIEAARHRVQIVNPYFLPTHTVRKAIYRALRDSVEVEIMIPSKADIPFTPDGSLYLAHRLMKRGAKVYLFDAGFHHSKAMMVDSLFSTVGSANLNSRSLRYDYETNAFIIDSLTTIRLSAIFERDKSDSRMLTPGIWKKVPFWKKVRGWFANLLTPFM